METIVLQFELSAEPAVPTLAEDTFDASGLRQGADNLGLAFFDIAKARSAHSAVETARGIYSYGWMLRAAESVRRHLVARPGHTPGDRVALKLPNSAEYVAAFYGALLADCVVVPLPVALERMRLQQIEDACQPQVLIVAKAEEGIAATTVDMIGTSCTQIERPAVTQQNNDLAMLLFTSGSTGLPKGVMLSHRNLLANAESILHTLPIAADDRALVLLPFCHSFGNSILQTHMLSGATMVFAGALMFPASIIEAIAKFNATSFSAVPEVYGMLMKYGRLGEQGLPKLRYMAVAGGQLRHELTGQIAKRISPAEFYVMYGQSEASARLTILPPDELEARPGSIGKPLSGIELAIRDEEGNSLPPGEVGMLCARGDNIMLGYWRDPVTTAEVLSGDGWLKTGDLAHYDEAGYFHIDGRANLLVKVQGYRVHPAEIEGVVEAQFPRSRAVALPMRKGEETRFALFLAPQDDARIDLAELRAVCLRELPPHKVPVHFEILDQLPLTSAYKVDRAALSLRIPRG
ncbi:MAG: acyl--CoA ligase [Xanthobacteraceae bacterium]|nr:acyl--CoA ligase [Xanthobacteraceae bacterium]